MVRLNALPLPEAIVAHTRAQVLGVREALGSTGLGVKQVLSVNESWTFDMSVVRIFETTGCVS
jgi:hypothetical protein